MNADIIYVAADMKNKANALREYAKNIQTSIAHIMETVNTFNTAWTGADASAYVTKLTSHIDAMNIKIASINNFADHLDLAASQFTDATQTNIDETGNIAI